MRIFRQALSEKLVVLTDELVDLNNHLEWYTIAILIATLLTLVVTIIKK